MSRGSVYRSKQWLVVVWRVQRIFGKHASNIVMMIILLSNWLNFLIWKLVWIVAISNCMCLEMVILTMRHYDNRDTVACSYQKRGRSCGITCNEVCAWVVLGLASYHHTSCIAPLRYAESAFYDRPTTSNLSALGHQSRLSTLFSQHSHLQRTFQHYSPSIWHTATIHWS